MLLVIVIPVYNEEHCIRDVVSEWLLVLKKINGKLIVVDDGSTDGTYKILKEVSILDKNLKIIQQENKGHGQAVVTGYYEALQLNPDYIFQTDSDAQFDSNDFYKLWEYRNKADLVIGFREYRNDSVVRIFVSVLMMKLIRVLYGKEIIDSNSPFRLYNASLLCKYLKIIPKETFIPNVLLSILYSGYKTNSHTIYIPVKHFRRTGGVQSLKFVSLIRAICLSTFSLINFRMAKTNDKIN